MSISSPADLAVAFRSLPRRLHQASGPTAPPSAIARTQAEIAASVQSAAELLGCTATSDAVGLAIEQRELNDWVATDIATLQAYAQTAARALRQLEDLAEEA